MVNSCFQAVTTIGMPESKFILAQCATYLACSEKSNASYTAINKAQVIVKQTGDLSVPLLLRNASTRLMKDLDYCKDYKYAHDYANKFVNQEFLLYEMCGKKFFEPGDNTRESAMRAFLKIRWKDKYGY